MLHRSTWKSWTPTTTSSRPTSTSTTRSSSPTFVTTGIKLTSLCATLWPALISPDPTFIRPTSVSGRLRRCRHRMAVGWSTHFPVKPRWLFTWRINLRLDTRRDGLSVCTCTIYSVTSSWNSLFLLTGMKLLTLAF